MEKNKLKIAVCLSGYLNHTKRGPLRTNILLNNKNNVTSDDLMNEKCSKDPPEIGYNSIKWIFENYDTDCFIHSWEVNEESNIKKIYSPKISVFEPQIDFKMNLSEYGFEVDNLNYSEWKNVSDIARLGYKYMIDDRVKKYTKDQIINEFEIQTFRVSSRFYSIKNVLELKDLYEKENNISYDYVLVLRFGCDWSFRQKFNFENLNNDYFYLEGRFGRIDENISVNDGWFLANSKNINFLKSFFDNRTKYCTRPPLGLFEHLNNKVKIYKV